MRMLLKPCETTVDRMIQMSIRTYSELITLPTFEERFRYLQLNGVVGETTFGFDRYLNQYLYQRSKRWKDVRDYVIIRDNGCDLACEDRMLYSHIFVHHMNPLTLQDLENESAFVWDPEYLISTSQRTHNAIHYGDENLLIKAPIERSKNDTCPWRH